MLIEQRPIQLPMWSGVRLEHFPENVVEAGNLTTFIYHENVSTCASLMNGLLENHQGNAKFQKNWCLNMLSCLLK